MQDITLQRKQCVSFSSDRKPVMNICIQKGFLHWLARGEENETMDHKTRQKGQFCEIEIHHLKAE